MEMLVQLQLVMSTCLLGKQKMSPAMRLPATMDKCQEGHRLHGLAAQICVRVLYVAATVWHVLYSYELPMNGRGLQRRSGRMNRSVGAAIVVRRRLLMTLCR